MGSSNSDAQHEAEAAEARRQAQIRAATGQINSVFNSPSRQLQYADFLEAARQLYMDELGKQQQTNARQLKFALARNGQVGSSLQIDQGRKMGEEYKRGVIDAERLAQSDQGKLKAADEDARMQLIAMAQSGMDATTGANAAARALQNNLQAESSSRTVGALGDVFGSFANIYKNSRDAAERRRGEKYAYGTIYQPGFFTGYSGVGGNR